MFYSTVVDCGTLNTTTNGQVSHPNGTTFRQTATYNCNTGYNLVGDSIRMCEADGMWSGSEPTCQGVLLYEIEYYVASESALQCAQRIKMHASESLLHWN